MVDILLDTLDVSAHNPPVPGLTRLRETGFFGSEIRAQLSFSSLRLVNKLTKKRGIDAIFARVDGAVFESGLSSERALAAHPGLRPGSMQQLRRAAA